eukprot:13206-Heterococcus_DN1.PRE.6
MKSSLQLHSVKLCKTQSWWFASHSVKANRDSTAIMSGSCSIEQHQYAAAYSLIVQRYLRKQPTMCGCAAAIL